jgi:hypothetical protein
MIMQRDRLIAKLIRSLDAPNSITRKNAAGALRLHGGRAASAIPALVRLLTLEADPHVQAEARRALRQLQRLVA